MQPPWTAKTEHKLKTALIQNELSLLNSFHEKDSVLLF